ncbi:MAG: hypothetical protein KY467_18545 [Gemmatimonadetes bacterium]|nr:hypothetical protein [Gemmatimonadota bacterium]
MTAVLRGRKLRVLNVHGALYVPYLLTQGLRKLGHRADTVYFEFRGPVRDLTWGCDYSLRSKWWALPQQAAFLAWAAARYDVFHFWAQPHLVPPLYNVLTKHYPLDLALLKKLGRKIVYQSDGCYTMIRPSVWKTQIDPEVCFVCQTTQGDTYGHCSNHNTIRLNAAMEKYADLRFGTGLGYDFEQGAAFEFFPVDTELWRPGLEIPPEHVYRRTRPGSVLVYHGVGSHVIGQRGNIKGTQWIRDTIAEMQESGYNVELMMVERVPNKMVRFYQAQADIVVDQLLLGGGGQNARECLAVGRPVLTRVHPEQWGAFDRSGGRPPFVPTERHNLRENLVRLIEDEELRRDLGAASAEFARTVLSPEACAARYLAHYESLFEKEAA